MATTFEICILTTTNVSLMERLGRCLFSQRDDGEDVLPLRSRRSPACATLSGVTGCQSALADCHTSDRIAAGFAAGSEESSANVEGARYFAMCDHVRSADPSKSIRSFISPVSVGL